MQEIEEEQRLDERDVNDSRGAGRQQVSSE